jgi:putative transposase
MTPTPAPETNAPAPLSQADFREALHEKLRSAIWLTLATMLEEEVTAFIGAPRYGRTSTRRDQRNGYYARDLITTAGKCEDLLVPRTRGGFRTQVFERYQRRQAELDTAISDMFIFGTSTTRVGEVVETLTGTHPSPSTVSRVFHSLEAEFTVWKTRPLAAHYVYVFADGTYFTVIYDHEGQKMPILAVIGINEQGEREVLAFTVGERENQGAWEDLLEQLKTRGVQRVDLWITDGNQAMLNAVQLKFSPPASAASSTKWTTCSATCPTSSATWSSRSSRRSSTRTTARRPTRRWWPSARSIPRRIRPPSSASSVTWTPV